MNSKRHRTISNDKNVLIPEKKQIKLSKKNEIIIKSQIIKEDDLNKRISDKENLKNEKLSNDELVVDDTYLNETLLFNESLDDTIINETTLLDETQFSAISISDNHSLNKTTINNNNNTLENQTNNDDEFYYGQINNELDQTIISVINETLQTVNETTILDEVEFTSFTSDDIINKTIITADHSFSLDDTLANQLYINKKKRMIIIDGSNVAFM